jgi:glycosyltransferase involved in cell wall biosynthesis
MEKVKVSIVIPMYNASQTIAVCIDSVIKQTYWESNPDNCELIVVNDGSIDDSKMIVKTIAVSIPNQLTLINQINKGVSVARNVGIEASKGEYIAFLDADDVWERDKLEIQMNLLKKNPSLSFLASAVNGKIINYFFFKRIKELQPLTPLELLLQSFFSTSGVIVKKNILQASGLFPLDMRYSEDLYLWIKIAESYGCCYLNQSLAHRQDNRIGLSANLKEMEKGQLKCIHWARKERLITGIEYIFVIMFSILKYYIRSIKKIIKK